MTPITFMNGTKAQNVIRAICTQTVSIKDAMSEHSIVMELILILIQLAHSGRQIIS